MTAHVILLSAYMLMNVARTESNGQAILSKRRCLLDSFILLDSCSSRQAAQTSLNTFKRIYGNDTHVVPEGAFCSAEFTPGNVVQVLCQAGSWRIAGGNSVLNTQEVTSLRRKRSSTFVINRWESENGDWISLTADKPPSITCPHLDRNIYTEKSSVTANVSWKVPTAPETENGVVSVTQTQGQAPGSDHSAGTYTVSYIARDAKGQASVCSETFTVVVRRCPHEFTYILNGTATCTLGDSYIYGSECSYTCASGHSLVGASSLQCQSDGTWSGSKPQCKAVTCGPPGESDHSYLACEISQYTFRSKCDIVCDTGYAITEGSDIITCQANGQWTPSGRCEVMHCQELEAPDNAGMNCSKNSTYGSVCYTTCEQNYLLTGEVSRVCQENGTWSGQLQECIKICPDQPEVPHGHYVCEGVPKYLDTCTLVCNKGCSVLGNLSITCDTNYQWTQGGDCQDTEPPEIAEDSISDIEVIAQELGTPTIVNYSVPNITDNSGDKVNVTMSPPSGSEFKLGNTTVTIMASDNAGNNGTFYFIVKVTARLCPDPSISLTTSDPLKFNCPNGFVLGAICNASCSDGKQPQGINYIRCHLNEHYNKTEWLDLNDVTPYCQEKCSPGQWSSTGQQPCTVCDIGTYQANYGSTMCEMCPYVMTTPIYGAVSKNDCVFYTILMGASQLQLPRILASDDIPESFTVMVWIRVDYNAARMTLSFTADPNKAIDGSAIVALDAFRLFIVPTEFSTAKSIRYWYHLALVFLRQSGEGKLYVNGKVTETIPGMNPQPLSGLTFEFGFTGTLFYFVKYPLRISAFQMTLAALNNTEMMEYYQSCQKQVDDSIFAPAVPVGYLPLTLCDDIDNCESSPCGVHSVCLDQGDTIKCECSDGWSGDTCQLPPNFCANNTCANGATCISNINSKNFTCNCSYGFKGQLCKNVIVNGGWSTWGEWSLCSKVCGPGQRSRTRSCNNPKPDPMGESCQGYQVQQQKCYGEQCPVNGEYGTWSVWSPCSKSCGVMENNRKRVCDNPAPSNGGSTCPGLASVDVLCSTARCPECSELKLRPGHQPLSCQKNADASMISCQIICKPGLAIMPKVLNRFQCGHLTNYVWSHRTEHNPNEILPDCAKLTLPTNATLVIKYVYDNASRSTAQPATTVTDSIQQTLLVALNCSTPLSCSHHVTVTTTCEEIRPVSGQLRVEIIRSTSTLPVDGKGNSLVDASKTLNTVFNNLTNTSVSILKSCVIGSDYTGHIETAKLILLCPDGSGYSGSACVDCPPGSYSPGNGSCILCGNNSYQDETRMASCKMCPICTTTGGEGSYSSEQCQPYSCGSPSIKEAENTPLPLIIGLAVGLGSFFIFAAFVAIIIQRSCRKRGREHPYDIPYPLDLRDVDPYANSGNEIYDEIEDSPYISAQAGSFGSVQLNSDGCVASKNDSAGYTVLQNVDPDNKHNDYTEVNNMDNGFSNNTEYDPQNSDLYNRKNSKSENNFHEAEHNEGKALYSSNAKNANDNSTMKGMENGLCSPEVKPWQKNDCYSDGSHCLDSSHGINTCKDRNTSPQAPSINRDIPQKKNQDIEDGSDSDRNPNNEGNTACGHVSVPRNPPLPHRLAKELKETDNQNLNTNTMDYNVRM